MNRTSALVLALRRIRQRRGVTQRKIAAATGRKVQAVSKWERGRAEVTASVLGTYLDCLDCDLLELDREVARAVEGAEDDRARTRTAPLPGRPALAAEPPEPLSPEPFAPLEREVELTEEEQAAARTEIQATATRAVSALLAGNGWSHTQAAYHCGWTGPDRISNSIERRAGWTLEKLAVLAAAAGMRVPDLLRLGYDSLDAERAAASAGLAERADAEAVTALVRLLGPEERQWLIGEVADEM